jgi:hypothetical protein
MSALPTTGHRRLALITGLAALGTVSAALVAPAEAASPTWQVVKTYNYSAYDSVSGVVALSTKNAWAFSGTNEADLTKSRPLAQHLNGTKWGGTTLPTGLRGMLFAGDSSSASNVWTIGGVDGAESYALRWNGKKWAVAKKWAQGQVTGVTAVSAKDVWVFGAPGADQGVGTWHYNGKSWKKVSTPFLPGRGSKVSGKDIWAVGRGLNSDSRAIGHWDGKKWKVVPTGGAVPADVWAGEGKPWRLVSVTDILARSAKDVWATVVVDSGAADGTASDKPLLIHWNGKSWKNVAAPATGTLTNVTPDGNGGLWFTGSVRSGPDSERGVIRHRTSAGKWSTATVSNAGKRLPRLSDLALFPGTRQVLGGGSLRPADDSGSDGAIFLYKG